MLAMTTLTTNAQGVYNKAAKQNSLPLVNEWDKTFPKSDKVRHEKVTFSNRFGITLAADLYIPKETNGPRSAQGLPRPKRAREAHATGL